MAAAARSAHRRRRSAPCERGTWPFLRASSRRLGVGCSVRSCVALGHGVSSPPQQLRRSSKPLPSSSTKLDCSGGMPTSTMSRPKTSEIGKPTANRLSDGAARLTTPNARLTISSAVMPGSATRERAREHRARPRATSVHRPSLSEPGRADRQGVETGDQHLDQREVAVEREEREHHEHARRAGRAPACCCRAAGRR